MGQRHVRVGGRAAFAVALAALAGCGADGVFEDHRRYYVVGASDDGGLQGYCGIARGLRHVHLNNCASGLEHYRSEVPASMMQVGGATPGVTAIAASGPWAIALHDPDGYVLCEGRTGAEVVELDRRRPASVGRLVAVAVGDDAGWIGNAGVQGTGAAVHRVDLAAAWAGEGEAALTTVAIDGEVEQVAAEGTAAAALATRDGQTSLWSIDATGARGQVTLPGTGPYALAMASGRAWVSFGTRLLGYDLGPDTPALVEDASLGMPVAVVSTAGSRLLGLSAGDVVVIDTAGGAPEVLGRYPEEVSATWVAAAGDVFYISAAEGGLWVYGPDRDLD
jgi:hypothetical protein